MQKKIIRSIALIALLALIVSTISLAANARSSEYIISTDSSINKLGGGDLKIEFSVKGTGKMTKIGASKIKVYKDNSTSPDVISYDDYGYSKMMGTNAYSYSNSITYKGSSGHKYYAIITLYAENSNGHDTADEHTVTITA